MNTYPSCLDRVVSPQPIVIEPDATDLRPKVIADLEVGQLVEWVDVDLDSVADRMRQEGISDRVIGQTVIRFSCESQSSLQKKTDRVTFGAYNREDGSIDINAKAFSLVYDSWIEYAADNGIKDVADQEAFADATLDTQLPRTLYHEIRHLRQHHTTPDMDQETIRKSVTRYLGGLAACVSVTALPIYSALDRLGYGGAGGSMATFTIAAWGGTYVYSKVASTEKLFYGIYKKLPSEKDAQDAEEEVSDVSLIEMRLRDDAV